MKNRILLLIFIVFTLNSCDPSTKDGFLMDYKDFVERVEDQYEEYSHEDWDDAKEEFKKFSVRLYNEFEDELSIKEKMICTKYRFQFNMYRLEKELSSFKEEDYDELKEKIEYYYDNHMEEDIELLKKQSAKASEDLQEVIEDFIEEIEENHK